MHNRLEIRQRILETLEEVIREQGTNRVSIRLIAQKAKVSKALIYRHFGSVQGLLACYVRQSPAFPHFLLNYLQQISLTSQEDVAQNWAEQMIHFFRQLRLSKASREVIKTSIVSDNGLAETINQTQHQELISIVLGLSSPEEVKSSATLAILLGGMYYLTLMAHNNQPMMGIDLRSEAGWLQVEQSIKTIIRKINEPIPSCVSWPNVQALANSMSKN